MAINIERITGYLLREKADKPHNILYRPERYLRLALSFTPAWYIVDDSGIIYDRAYNQSELENLFKESNGFLEQLELF